MKISNYQIKNFQGTKKWLELLHLFKKWKRFSEPRTYLKNLKMDIPKYSQKL